MPSRIGSKGHAAGRLGKENYAMNAMVEQMLKAGRAEAIPEHDRGLWYIRRWETKVATPAKGKYAFCPPGIYTYLFRWTDSTIYQGRGEIVMEDTPIELSKHLQAALTARGQVLVTGLGLACVVRMMQQNPRVKRITIVERDADVIEMVWPHTPHDKCELIHDEAMKFINTTD